MITCADTHASGKGKMSINHLSIGKEIMRIELDNREKHLIHEYWYTASKEMQSQLLNTRRKTIDIEYEQLQDLVGFLAAACNHCRNKTLAAELDQLCDRLEAEI